MNGIFGCFYYGFRRECNGKKKILGFMLTVATVPEGCGNLKFCGHQLIILPFRL